MQKLAKGHYGYLTRRKHGLLIKVGIMLLGILLLFITGYIATGTRGNLLTVVAVVSVLPMANQAVILLAVLPYKSRKKEEYEQVVAIVGDGLLNTELMITSKKDKTLEIAYAYIHERGVFCYTANKDTDIKVGEAYIEEMLKNNSLKSDVTIFKDFQAFTKRLASLEPESREDCDEKLLKIEGVIRAIAI